MQGTELSKLPELGRREQRALVRQFDKDAREAISKAQTLISKQYLASTEELAERSQYLTMLGDNIQAAIIAAQPFLTGGTNPEARKDTPGYLSAEKIKSGDEAQKLKIIKRLMARLSDYTDLVNRMRRMPPPVPYEPEDTGKGASFIQSRSTIINMPGVQVKESEPIDTQADFEQYAEQADSE